MPPTSFMSGIKNTLWKGPCSQEVFGAPNSNPQPLPEFDANNDGPWKMDLSSVNKNGGHFWYECREISHTGDTQGMSGRLHYSYKWSYGAPKKLLFRCPPSRVIVVADYFLDYLDLPK